jgi:hypothetical protein
MEPNTMATIANMNSNTAIFMPIGL